MGKYRLAKVINFFIDSVFISCFESTFIKYSENTYYGLAEDKATDILAIRTPPLSNSKQRQKTGKLKRNC
jgi:hypothetical protein